MDKHSLALITTAFLTEGIEVEEYGLDAISPIRWSVTLTKLWQDATNPSEKAIATHLVMEWPEAQRWINERAANIAAENLTRIRDLEADEIAATYDDWTVERAPVISQDEFFSAQSWSSYVLLEQRDPTGFKQWVTQGDGNVRDSHSAAAAQGSIPVTERFNNGLRYPTDRSGPLSEWINCRCFLA